MMCWHDAQTEYVMHCNFSVDEEDSIGYSDNVIGCKGDVEGSKRLDTVGE
jgi:hypothetical protein